MQMTFEQFVPVARIKAHRLYNDLGLGWMTHDIEDLCQELILVAWLAVSSFEPDRLCSLNTWVNRKMDYFLLDYKRAYARRRIRIEYVGDLTDLQKLADSHQAVQRPDGRLFDWNELAGMLDPKLRTILGLYLDGLTQDEIAAQLRYKDNSGVARQLKKLREICFQLIHRSLGRPGRRGPRPN